MKSLAELASQKLPRFIQQTWEANDSNMPDFLTDLEELASDVKLEGRFYGEPNIDEIPNEWVYGLTPVPLRPIMPMTLIPRFYESEIGYNLRWDSYDNLSWWAEFNFIEADPGKSKFKGRNIPLDCKLTSHERDGGTIQFRYDSASKPEFWAKITISGDPPFKKAKTELFE